MRNDYSIAYQRYSWEYGLPEIMARIEGVGLWQGDFERLEDLAAQPSALSAFVSAPICGHRADTKTKKPESIRGVFVPS